MSSKVLKIIPLLIILATWWHFSSETNPALEEPKDSKQILTSPDPKIESPPEPQAHDLDVQKMQTSTIETQSPLPTTSTFEEKAADKPSHNPFKEPQKWVPFERVGPFAVMQKDILMGKLDPQFQSTKGKTEPRKSLLWPSNEIPYYIDPTLPHPERVTEAIEYFHRETVIRFVPLQSDAEDGLWFQPHESLCASYLGRVGGHQPIFLSSKCNAGNVKHEIMHALSFVHEHSRTDRDRFIEVIWDNIEEAFWPQFALFPDILIHNYSGSVFDFDFESIMLYPPNAFAKSPDQVTLRSRTGEKLQPQRERLSKIDIERLYYLYGQ
jgi:hypothetical protein